MLPRRRFHPEDHFSIGIPLNHSHGLACGDMIFVGGQVDLNPEAEVTTPGDLKAQTRIAMEGIARVLDGLGADLFDLVKLSAFYVTDGTVVERDLLQEIARHLPSGATPGPAITLVPLEALAFPGMEIEIEAIAMRDQNGGRLPRAAAWIPDGAPLPPAFSQALRCGQLLFASGQSALDDIDRIAEPGRLVAQSGIVLSKLDRLLHQLGGDLQDAVKANVFNVEPGHKEEWKEAALVRAGFYREPGPTATGISLPRLSPEGLMVRTDVIAMRGLDGARLQRSHAWPSGHWDWPVHLPYRHGLRCGDLVFLGGQVSLAPDSRVVDPGDMEAQTHRAMRFIGRVLEELGLSFENIVKANAFYTGQGNDAAELHQNLSIRSSYYGAAAPVSTGVPVPYLAYEEMVIEIDVVAMV
ncbi:MAG: RidA family protein [Pseudomonadota bacterium]